MCVLSATCASGNSHLEALHPQSVVARGTIDAAKAQVKNLATLQNATKLQQGVVFAKMGGGFSQEEMLSAQVVRICKDELTKAHAMAVFLSESVGVKYDKTSGRYHRILLFQWLLVKARADWERSASDTLDQLRKLYEKFWSVSTSASATRVSEVKRPVLELELARLMEGYKLHDAKRSAHKASLQHNQYVDL